MFATRLKLDKPVDPWSELKHWLQILRAWRDSFETKSSSELVTQIVAVIEWVSQESTALRLENESIRRRRDLEFRQRERKYGIENPPDHISTPSKGYPKLPASQLESSVDLSPIITVLSGRIEPEWVSLKTTSEFFGDLHCLAQLMMLDNQILKHDNSRLMRLDDVSDLP